ncbi:MAG: ABC transporter permease subunit, partial [Betaproteobacteria bacterium]
MDTLIQQLMNGLVLGSVYALVALGYTMVYGILQLINFAHGDVLMIGAMVSLTVLGIIKAVAPSTPLVLQLVIATAVAVPVCMLIAAAIERIAYRPLRN